MIRIKTALAALVLVSACTSTPDPRSGAIDPGGGLMGIGAEERAFWEEWTPRKPATLSVSPELRPATLFDVWSVDDDAFHQLVWDPTFHALHALALRQDDLVTYEALHALMIRLEPGVEQARWELSFLSEQEGSAEGVVLRMVLDDGAGLWLEAIRDAQSGEGPRKWVLRVEPAVEEARGMTAWLEQLDDEGDDGWKLTRAVGADAAEADSWASSDPLWSDLAELWSDTLWEAVTGRDYLEPEFAFSEADREELAPGWPGALGKPVRQRGIDDFVTQTVFTPRMGDEGLEHF